MLGIVVKNNCQHCNIIVEAISLLDRRIEEIARNAAAQLSHLSTKRYGKREIKSLITYRRILTNLYWNNEYYECFNYVDIVSKVKSLI